MCIDMVLSKKIISAIIVTKADKGTFIDNGIHELWYKEVCVCTVSVIFFPILKRSFQITQQIEM